MKWLFEKFQIWSFRAEVGLKLMARKRGVLLRGLLCWILGILILNNDEVKSYDTRLKLRGDQSVSQDIVLITLSPSDLRTYDRYRSQIFGTLREIGDITDSFYWQPQMWANLMKKVLSEKPAKVGVTLFFSEALAPIDLPREDLLVLKDPRVIWAANSTLTERTNYPLLTNGDKTNIGNNDLLRDEDGVIRRFVPAGSEVPHLVEKITGQSLETLPSRFINYRGGSGRFSKYTLSEVMDSSFPGQALKNKIILIGPESNSSSQYMTPLGPTLRTEVIAQVIDNTINKRWITRLHDTFYAIGLLFLMLLSVFVISQYPQSIALVFLIWMGTVIASLSAWVFDSYYIWTPAVSPAIQLAATWVIFIGYQATKIERKNWELQQEQKYLQELEQLKNNFVSLISHDLKTPIAKIQAIVDRLLNQFPQHEFNSDLKSLRLSSEELNRYIQSILKVLRVESRDFKLHKEVSDINELIQEALTQLQPLAREKSIEITLDLEPMFSIEVDITLIREVLINLIENAIKYTSTGGKIKITSREIDNQVRVDVADTGEGIPANEVDNVWRKFVRGQNQDLKTKGTGLGLYLVKYFIELHDGKINLESEVGKGTTVSFTLPLEDDSLTEETAMDMAVI